VPELLDELAPTDPLARRSRSDLQRLHRIMGTHSMMLRELRNLRLPHPPVRILELGAGDGTLMLRLAHALAPVWPCVQLTLLDRHELLSRETRAGFGKLNWEVSVLCTDVLDWARTPCAQHYDLCISALFLHHFSTSDLGPLLASVMSRADAFVAFEPRRNAWTRFGSRLVGIVGGNAVTRSDARTSVDAGFLGQELTRSWPGSDENWTLKEMGAFPFTHCFSARRRDPTPSREDS
jgi:hypothetical protein